MQSETRRGLGVCDLASPADRLKTVRRREAAKSLISPRASYIMLPPEVDFACGRDIRADRRHPLLTSTTVRGPEGDAVRVRIADDVI